ncbi:unnamed protein product [Mytilus edulis]|uniref:Uncharacterized protein n=1 Tax=Mytilus edulis TaxID=6550 RepID=A0A8S3S6Q8_MYTED|nr:unnamed protein product [Mytilus edulis]
MNVGRRILRLRALKHKPKNSAAETVSRGSRDLNTMYMLPRKTQGDESETHISMAPKGKNQDNCYHSFAKSTTLQDKTDCDRTVDISNKYKDEITNKFVDQNIQLDSCSSISKTTSIIVESDSRIQNNSNYSNTDLETKKLKKRLRVTLMLFVITTVFIISFLPYLTTEIVGSLNSEIWKNMSNAEQILRLRSFKQKTSREASEKSAGKSRHSDTRGEINDKNIRMAFKGKTQDENVHSSEDSPNGEVKQVKPHCDNTIEKSKQNQNIGELSKDIHNQDSCCSISKAAPVIVGSGNL